jgi:hypothetical protein
VRFCPTKVFKLIKEKGFPAQKIGGSWTSKKELINEWWNSRLDKDEIESGN